MKKPIQLSIATLLAFSGSAMADPFVYYVTSFSGPSDNTGVFAGANQQPLSIFVELDNGGNTRSNQTWNAAHVSKIMFRLNGNIVTTIAPNASGSNIASSGSSLRFETDASGNLSAVANRLSGNTSTAAAVTAGTDSSVDINWGWANAAPGSPNIYNSNANANRLSVLNSVSITTPGNWQYYGASLPSGSGGNSGGSSGGNSGGSSGGNSGGSAGNNLT
ncbi:MAG: hypothetical protein OIF38_05690, partial [Cellvibrionaceae bacterium]|nr:hypothetical protein [Cellvibrionaceae bacterium]